MLFLINHWNTTNIHVRWRRMITHDIQRFSSHLAAIYANMAKPVLDVILYNYQLSQNVGAEGLVILTCLVQLSAALRTSSTDPLIKHGTRTDFRDLAVSASINPALWSLYRSVRTALRLPTPHPFTNVRVCGRNCVLRRRGDGEDVGRERICWTCHA